MLRRAVAGGIPGDHRAFRWHIGQPVTFLVAAVLGLLSGYAFRSLYLPIAWQLFIYGFVWILVMTIGLGFWLSYRGKVARGDWRVSFHVGMATAFPLTTLYLAGVLLLTFAIPLAPMDIGEGKQALSRPNFVQVGPVCYLLAFAFSIVCGPLYAGTSPLQRDHHLARDRFTPIDAS